MGKFAGTFGICSVCDQEFEYKILICEECEEEICDRCMDDYTCTCCKDDDALHCPHCDDGEIDHCETCGKLFCVENMQYCEKCNEWFCENDYKHHLEECNKKD
jgi:hypothetical protein